MTQEEFEEYAKEHNLVIWTKEETEDILKKVMEFAEDIQKIKALGEDMRITQKGIADEKVLFGFNMAIALCNKHLGRGE